MAWTKRQVIAFGLLVILGLVQPATGSASAGACTPNEGSCDASTETRPLATDSILLQTRSANIKRTDGDSHAAILDHEKQNWGNHDCQQGRPIISRRRRFNDFCSCRRRHTVNYEGEDPRWRCRGTTMVYSEPGDAASTTTAPTSVDDGNEEEEEEEEEEEASTTAGEEVIIDEPETSATTTAEMVIDEPAQDPATTPPTVPAPTACLCVFDIDRTLTGKQERTDKCPDNEILWNLEDHAYEGGRVTLSDLARQGISKTFCNQCYLGITSAGAGSGADSPWNAYLFSSVMRSTVQDEFQTEHPEALSWSFGRNQASHQLDVHSPYVLLQPDKQKQDAVELVRQWYEARGVYVAPDEVYFFGDRTENIEPFSWKGFNSKEISCGLRDYNGVVGFCGARLEEVVKMKGNWKCSETAGQTA